MGRGETAQPTNEQPPICHGVQGWRLRCRPITPCHAGLVGTAGMVGTAAPVPTPPDGGGFAPSAAAPTAAELGPGLAPRRSKAGKKPEAAAVSRKPRAAVSRFSGACVSAGMAARAPAPPVAHGPHHPLLAVGTRLTAHFIWEKPRHGNTGEVPGESQRCCVTQKLTPQNPIQVHALRLPRVFRLTGTTPRTGAFTPL